MVSELASAAGIPCSVDPVLVQELRSQRNGMWISFGKKLDTRIKFGLEILAGQHVKVRIVDISRCLKKICIKLVYTCMLQ